MKIYPYSVASDVKLSGTSYDKGEIIYLQPGEKLTFPVELSTDDTDNADNLLDTLLWTSSSTDIATITSNDGTVTITAGTTEGTAKITALEQINKTMSKDITVKVSSTFSYNQFVKALIDGDGTFDGDTYSDKGYKLDEDGRLIVAWSPQSGCRALGTANHKAASCDKVTAATYETPHRVNSSSAQYQITQTYLGDTKDITISNVHFSFDHYGDQEGGAWWSDSNSAWAHVSDPESCPGAEIQLENSGNTTITNCYFKEISLTPFHNNGTVSGNLVLKDSIFDGSNYGIKGQALRGVKSKGIIVEGCSFSYCGSAIYLEDNSLREDGDIQLINNTFAYVDNGEPYSRKAAGEFGVFKLADITDQVIVSGIYTYAATTCGPTLVTNDIAKTLSIDTIFHVTAGTYNVDPSDYVDFDIYTVVANQVEDNTWTVCLPVTITAKPQTITYGTDIASGVENVTVSGLQDGDTLTAITLTPSTSSVTATGTITPSGAVITSGDTDITRLAYGITYKPGALVITASAPTITAAPQANTLHYTGAAQALVTDGTASGGTILYALTQDADATPEGSAFTYTSSPTATEVGTYYVWYRIAGDSNHEDSDVFGPIAVRIYEAISTLTDASVTILKGQAKTLELEDSTGSGARTWTLGTDAPSWVKISQASDSKAVIAISPLGTLASGSYEFSVTITNSDGAASSATVRVSVISGILSSDSIITEGAYELQGSHTVSENSDGQSVTSSRTEFANGSVSVITTEIAITSESIDLYGLTGEAFTAVVSVDVSIDIQDPDFTDYNYSLDVMGLPDSLAISGDLSYSGSVNSSFTHVFTISGTPEVSFDSVLNVRPVISVSNVSLSLVSSASKDIHIRIEEPVPVISAIHAEISGDENIVIEAGESIDISQQLSVTVTAEYTDGSLKDIDPDSISWSGSTVPGIAITPDGVLIVEESVDAGTYDITVIAAISAGDFSCTASFTLSLEVLRPVPNTPVISDTSGDNTLYIPDTVSIDDAIESLTEEQKQSVESVNLSEYQRSTLTDDDLSSIIDKLPSLSTLDLSNCSNIEVINAKGKEALTSINLADCESLSTLNLGGCSSLSELSGLSGNTSVNTIDASGCSSLKELVVNNCSALVSLDCSGSAISLLDVDGCTSLAELDCSYNYLGAIDLMSCVNLQRLYCYSNNLETLELPGERLEWLVCDNNRLQTLDIQDSRKLRRLDCQNNGMGALVIDRGIFSSIEWLKCYGQKIADLRGTGNRVDLSRYVRNTQAADSVEDLTGAADTSNVVNVKGYDSHGSEIGLLAYDASSGVATFASTPAKVTYGYNTGFEGIVMDVTVGETVEYRQHGVTQSDNGGSSGGCDAGFGAIMLALLGIMLIRRS